MTVTKDNAPVVSSSDVSQERLLCAGLVALLLGYATWVAQMVLLRNVQFTMLATKYDFKPISTLASSLVALFEGSVVTGAITAVCVAWSVKPRATGGNIVVAAVHAVGVVILVVMVWEHVDSSRRAAQEDQFAIKYNEFYCNARTLQVCVEEVDKYPAVLPRLVFGDKTTSLNSSSGSNDPSVWLHCRALVNARMTEIKHKKLASNTGLVSKPTQTFLEDSTITVKGGLWCGSMLQLQMNSTKPFVATNSSQQPLLGSPYEANKRMFDTFKSEPDKQLRTGFLFLGAQQVLMTLQAAVLFRLTEGLSARSSEAES